MVSQLISEDTYKSQIPLGELSSTPSLADSIDDSEESPQEDEEAEPWLSYKVGDRGDPQVIWRWHF